MIDEREDAIWLRIARGLDPIATQPGDCGCSVINDAVPTADSNK